MSAQNIFLLGVGAQKTGTTWLHAYLNSLTDADFGRFIECHVFDALYLPQCAHFMVPDFLFIKSVLWRIKGRLKGVVSENYLRRRMQQNTRVYFDYFAGILKGKENIRLTGDITPSYCGLPVSVYHTIRQEFEKRGIRVKAVFLMRDPVERCWSAVRMHRFYRAAGKRYIDVKAPEEEALRFYFPTEQAAFRTNYHRTIANLEAAFPQEDIYYGFYESLFNENEISRITSFAGVDFAPPDLKKKINATPRDNGTVSSQLKADIAKFYKPVYDFIEMKFAERNVKSLWEGYKYL